MIVELKQVKITRSIFNQLLYPFFPDLLKDQNFKVLGWVFNKSRYILLYYPESNSLKRVPIISDLKIDETKPTRVYFKIHGQLKFVEMGGYSEAINWITKINTIDLEAKAAGQLFIK